MELTRNPFYILGATSRDDRRRILELAEEKSLVSDEDVVREATATLTNPRKRLSAELAWLPGLGPKRIAEALSVLEANPVELRHQRGVPPLARANLLADGLVRAVKGLNVDDVAQWIVELAEAHDELDAETTATLLNEERSVAGFQNISDVQHIESELQSRRQHYRRAIKDALDRLPTASLVKVVTRAVEQATDDGKVHAPILIDDLVDSFEVEAQDFLEKEMRNISALVSQVRTAAEAEEDESHVLRLVAKLESVVKNWDTVAQPIQVSARSRGIDHDLSDQVAGEVRGLAVELYNEHSLLDVSKRLMALQEEVFAEVDWVVEQTEVDLLALDEIAEQRTQFLRDMEAKTESWKREITYEADIGVLFKDKLRISPDGVVWKGKGLPLGHITRVRWGGTRRSVNGIPTGTTYNIFVGSAQDGTSIELKKQQVYSEFVDRLWRAVGARLLTEMLEGLREGKRWRFGTAVVSDHGVELERQHFLSADERVPCNWNDLVIGNGAGTFYIAKKDEKKVSVELPYQDMDNVHVLEAAMRIFWKKASPRLSDLLSQAD